MAHHNGSDSLTAGLENAATSYTARPVHVCLLAGLWQVPRHGLAHSGGVHTCHTSDCRKFETVLLT
jgi:hypothetical protein